MMCYELSDGDKQVFPGMDGAAQATGACTLFCFFLSAFLVFTTCIGIFRLYIFFFMETHVFLVGVRRPMQEAYIFEDHVDDSQYHLCEHL